MIQKQHSIDLNKKRWGALSNTITENIDENAARPQLKDKIKKVIANKHLFRNDDAETDKCLDLACKINKIDIY